jgi:diacylglycerol O-acyltransferase
VSGLAHGRDALIVVVHHAVADGIGGLAVLAQIADDAPRPATRVLPPMAPKAKGRAPV